MNEFSIRKFLDNELQRHSTRIYFVCYIMTPAVAQYILQNCHVANNRNLIQGNLKKITADMTAQLWQLTHQGIAFNVMGQLFDGQHRLQAIVDSGVAVPLLVFFEVPYEVMDAIDGGKVRSLSAAAKIKDVDLDSTRAACGAHMMAGLRSSCDASVLAKLEFCARHIEAIDFATRILSNSTRGVRTAPVEAVIGRAFYSAPRERLIDFGEQLKTGVCKNHTTDSTVIVLRNALIASSKSGKHGGVETVRRYAITECALRAFLDYKPRKGIKPVETEQFPLPEEASVTPTQQIGYPDPELNGHARLCSALPL